MYHAADLSPKRSAALPGLLLFCAFLLALIPTQAAAESFVEISTTQDHFVGTTLEPFDIVFSVHPGGEAVQGISFPLEINFSNGNIIGEIDEWPNGDAQLLYSSRAVETFASLSFNGFGPPGDPDTMLVGMISFGPPWQGTGERFRIHVVPTDTGSFDFGVASIPPGSGLIAFNTPAGGTVFPTLIMPTIHVPPKPETIRYRITTSTLTDTLFFGNPVTIHFRLDASGQNIAGIGLGHTWGFSNGNIIGPHSDETGEVVLTPAFASPYESLDYGDALGNNPDTSRLGAIDFDGQGYNGDGTIWSLTFTPTDTGTIFIDTATLPPACCPLLANDSAGNSLPVDFIPGRIAVVPCPYDLMGDVNQDQVLSSADIIYSVNYTFKSGPDPLPDRSVGDVNCSGGVSGADIIWMVNHIFKGGPEPCPCIVQRI
jgi:hypothetical protein